MADTTHQPVVEVVGGRLIGRTVFFKEEQYLNVDTQVDIFQGVPFANPPERFKAPVPREPWEGNWDATHCRDLCSQILDESDQNSASEDCLYLNIYLPRSKPDNAPVMVYIPGGAFLNGGASEAIYDGTALAACAGVIVVTVGYRVGVFGVFTTGNDEATGNYALLDQVAALQWLQENIGAFGGDKDRVTIFGQSAGAGSIGFLLLSPLAVGLFNQAILQSGSALSPRYFRNDPEAERSEARKLAELVGCPSSPSDALVACLRTVPEEDLLKAQGSVYESGYFIRLDGKFLPDTPENLRQDLSAPMPRLCAVMAGFNKQEGTTSVLRRFPEYRSKKQGPHINRTTFDLMVTETLLGADKHTRIRDAVLQEYAEERQGGEKLTDNVDNKRSGKSSADDYFDAYVSFYGDYIWGSGSDATLRGYEETGVANLYQYHFTHTPSSSFARVGAINPSWLGASHSEEIQFVFGWPFSGDILKMKSELMHEEKLLSAKMMKMWTNFAKTGNPTRNQVGGPEDPDLPVWPRFTVPELQYLDLGLECRPRQAVEARGMAFWNQYIPSLRSTVAKERQGEL